MSDYYTIGEAAGLVGLPEHTLRYWETEFKILHPIKRNDKNNHDNGHGHPHGHNH